MAELTNESSIQKERRKCIRKFLHYFPKGFVDKKYFAWERQYKLDAHLLFKERLNHIAFQELLKAGNYHEIALIAVKIESKTNLLFSFEKMALRDALKEEAGAKHFAHGLFNYIYGKDSLEDRFNNFTGVIASLPRKQTRVLTWPLQTVFGFIANPQEHIFLKPRVTKIAAEKYRFPFQYASKPNWETYKNMLEFAGQIKQDTAKYNPADYIDLQSFIWVMGSEEYL